MTNRFVGQEHAILPDDHFIELAFAGETIHDADLQVEFGGAGCTAFELVQKAEPAEITDGKVELIGPEPATDAARTDMDLGIIVKLTGARVKPDFENYLEGQMHDFINYAEGIEHIGKQDRVAIRVSKGAAAKGFTLEILGKLLCTRFHDHFGSAVQSVQVALVTDPGLHAEWLAKARAAGKIVAADPNPRHSIDWRGVTVVKPNRAEAFLAAGLRWRDPDEIPEKDNLLEHAGSALLDKWQTKYVLVTLGEHGMMLFQHNDSPHYIPTKARQVFDVSGAGDTAIALFTLGLVCGATPIEAAEIANHGSAVVVSKLGTATVTRDELIASFQHHNDDA